ncbi:hypothetical protein GOP47_0027641 [Adiantum capillus-veneris]|nr:hypothetical protein GOP47_0027641 [Adiantum capillus-veneris]
MDRDNGSTMSSSLEQIYEVGEAAKHVVVCHGCFSQLSSCLGKIRLLLHDVLEAAPVDITLVHSVLRRLDTELKSAKELVAICTIKSKFYLLLNCHAYAKCIQAILSSLASVLLDLSSDHVDLTLKVKSKIKLLCRDMQTVQIRVSPEEEDLVKSAEHAACNCYVDAKHANELLYKLGSVAGISLERSSLKWEFDELRREKGMVTPHKHENEVFQLDCIISLLSCADALCSATEREQQYHEQRAGMGSNFLPPLQTFYCPITQDVMENPVEIDSGHTFEMAAIQKWFAEGHRVCPVSKMELQSLSLKPNRLLLQSIEEWKDRNTVIKLAAMAKRLTSGKEELITEALLELQFLCEERSVHKYWVAAEGLIPVLVGLLGSSKRELKKKTLATLTILVADNSENRIKVCDAGAIEYAVRSLARDAGEARQAVALLSELCKEESLCKSASKVQGCILLLVTIASSDNTVAATNAKELLSLFTKDDRDVVQMAEVNYFGPLLECLDKGSQSTQILMANTLSRMQLSDQSRALLVQKDLVMLTIYGGVKEIQVMLTLTKDGGGSILAEEMTPDSYMAIVDLFSSASLEEEKAAAMGILGNLPLYNRQFGRL